MSPGPEWLPFEYREFYDYPRAILIQHDSAWFLLESPFLDESDDYANYYRIVRLSGEPAATASWDRLDTGGETVGQVSIAPHLFDSTRRREIRWDLLQTSGPAGDPTLLPSV